MGSMSVPMAEKSSFGWSVTLSILMIVAGLLAITVPRAAAIAVNILVGWLLVFSGAFHLVLAWHLRHRLGGIVWEGLIGLLYAVVGAFVLARPALGLISLALAIAAYLLAEGILELILYFRVHGVAGSGWLLFDGIITLILAVMIWRLWPSRAEWVIGTLVGISMLFSGTARLMLTFAARRLMTRATA